MEGVKVVGGVASAAKLGFALHPIEQQAWFEVHTIIATKDIDPTKRNTYLFLIILRASVLKHLRS